LCFIKGSATFYLTKTQKISPVQPKKATTEFMDILEGNGNGGMLEKVFGLQ